MAKATRKKAPQAPLYQRYCELIDKNPELLNMRLTCAKRLRCTEIQVTACKQRREVSMAAREKLAGVENRPKLMRDKKGKVIPAKRTKKGRLR
jgi:hypothetical protein